MVFSKTKGWKHSSIPFGISAILKFGKENNFKVDTTTNSKLFTDDYLKKFNAVIFNSTTGNILNAQQQAAFETYIQAGGGYVGIHAAADTEYEWAWYGNLMGAHNKEDGEIDHQKVNLLFDYIPEPTAASIKSSGFDAPQKTELPGKSLISNSDCKACHTIEGVSVGPSYLAVSNKYKNQDGAIDLLAKKIIDGGGGNWGTTYIMSAHPQVSLEDSRKMVEYILSLAHPEKKYKILPLWDRYILSNTKKNT
ncbi:MAG: ThuA domain-containing protein [Bacteroidota bacterium]|nr:ThuA domain-containing protein [Bacteroidota bacterium]